MPPLPTFWKLIKEKLSFSAKYGWCLRPHKGRGEEKLVKRFALPGLKSRGLFLGV